MKKTRGKKKRVIPSKKVNNFFIFKNKVAPIVLIIALLALTIFLSFVTTGNAVNNSNGNVISGNAVGSSLDNPAPVWITNVTNFLGIGDTWKQVIIGIIIMLIIFAGFYDILELTSIFSNSWVITLIAAGLAIILALVDVVRQIATLLFTFAATLGAIGIFLEIVVCIIIFIGLTFGGSRIALWAAKRKGQKELIKGIKSADEAGAAISGLRRIQKRFKKNP